jgi:hypothetical protein
MPTIGRFGFMVVTSALLAACGGDDLAGPATGSIRVTVATTGDVPDADGYLVALDDGSGQRIGTAAVSTFADLLAGNHQVTLGDLAPNCRASGELRRTVLVEAGGIADLAFDVTCPAASGGLRLVLATTGEAPDPDGYQTSLDGGTPLALPPDGEVLVTPVSSGDHTLAFSGLAPNCAIDGPNPRPITVAAGTVLTVDVAVACVAPAGTIQITATTIGSSQDPDGYLARLDDGPPTALPSSGSLEFTNVPVGEHSVELSGVANNCTLNQPNRVTVSVTNGGTAHLAYDLSCVGRGRILFTSDRTGSNHVYVMKEDGSGVTDLTPGARGEQAAWSPDRSRIAFVRQRGERFEIYVMRADGSNPVRITQAGGQDPAWSPDGRQIAFSNGSISIMNADGTGARTLVAGRHPSWSPDGTTLAFDRGDGSRCIPIILLCSVSVYTITADGTQERRLTGFGTTFDQSERPAWSPDGQRIGFREGGFALPARIALVSATGTVLGSLSPGTLELGAPVWSPDGAAVAVGADSRIQVAPVAGGPAVTLLGGQDTKVPTSWR